MGVLRKVEEAMEEFRGEGFYVYHTTWAETTSGSRHYEFLVDPRSGRTLMYKVIPSTYGTHPHVVFAVPPKLDEVIVASYARSSRGVENYVTVEKCKVKVSDGEVVLVNCIELYNEELERDEILSEDEVRKIGELVAKAHAIARSTS